MTELEEQQANCPYCHEDDNQSFYDSLICEVYPDSDNGFGKRLNYATIIDLRNCVLVTCLESGFDLIYETTAIKNCPMCGRKLGEDE